MKISYLIFIALYFCLPLNLNAQKSNFKVNLTFVDPNNEIADGEEIMIRKSGSSDILSSGQIKNKNVILSGTVDGHDIGMIETKNQQVIKGMKILLENVPYEMNINIDSLNQNPSQFYFKNRLKTTSSFYNVWKDFADEMIELSNEKREITNLFSTYVNTDKHKADSLLKIIDGFEAREDFLYKKLAYTHPKNFATAYILTAVPRFNKDYILIYENLSNELKRSIWGQQIKKQLDNLGNNQHAVSKNQLLGNIIPELSGIMPNGLPLLLNLNKIREDGGKLILIDFWASWCGPCRTANVDLYATFYKYKEKGLRIYSFSLDTEKEKWLKAIQEDKIPWTNFSNLQQNNALVLQNFGIKYIPWNVLLNKEGIVIGLNVQKDKIAALMEDL